MGLKGVGLFIVALLIEIFFLSQDLHFKNNNISLNKIDIEFQNSKTFQIDKNNINTILVCDKIQQLKGYKLFYKPIATIYDTNLTKTIIANFARLDDKTNILTLKDNIKIIYHDKILKTNLLVYNTKTKIVTDSQPFIINSKNFNAKGNHLYFDTNFNIMKASNITYNLNIGK